MGVLSLYLPLLVRDAVGPGRADGVAGCIAAISMAVIFLASPILGAMTDRAPRRMPFLVVSTGLCVLFTALLGRFSFTWTALFFVLANIAYQAGVQFYDALLPEVSTPKNRGRVGGAGVAVGYLGSFVAIGLGWVLGKDDKPLLFAWIAALFLLFALPCFFFVRERGNPHPEPITIDSVISSLHRTIATLRSSTEAPGLARFLVGRLFYTDAVNTVIMVMALYSANLAVGAGQTESQAQTHASTVLGSAIGISVLGGFFWGRMADRLGPRRTLHMVLQGWIATLLFAAAIGLFGLPLWTLYLVAVSAGFLLAGLWTADRPFMLRLTPPDRVGEFYGLYGMAGRFAAITGPGLWALMSWITIQRLGMPPARGQAWGALGLTAMVLTGYLILRPVSDAGPANTLESQQPS